MRKKIVREPAPQAGKSREAGMILLVIACTLALFYAFSIYLVKLPRLSGLEMAGYFLLLFGLAFCCVSYQLNRFGAAKRRRTHVDYSQAELAYLFTDRAPSVTVLIPSYREERRVLLMTILSAALAQYAKRRIVVLVDDPPADQPSVRRTLATVDEVRALLEEPIAELRRCESAWRKRTETGPFRATAEKEHLAKAYRFAAEWLDGLAASLKREVAPEFLHVDGFVIDKIVLDLATVYRDHAKRILGGKLDAEAAAGEYGRLASLFCVDIDSFQRKTFENLSHAPNKAMNLNAYIGLMGGTFDVVEKDGKSWMEEAPAGSGEFAVADSELVLTLDADSVVLSDYILKLAHILEHNPTYGVAQTPYLTFPNGSSAVERIAGATTDIQYLVHQGSTYFNASYWVGANALIRMQALRDICVEQDEGGKTVKVFIQDATVIEDTGSTIDLLDKGWTVHNHFTPLAYSATPADFGALTIQRKRWSNGGLIIFPMLLKQFLRNPNRFDRIPELALRANYLLSPVIGNLSIFLLMIWSSPDGRALIWTPLVMFPYFVLYGLDLRRLGYNFFDIIRVCALNLMLLPVSFAGIGASIIQMITGRKGAFSRTPKVANRTFIPPYCFLFNVGMMSLMGYYVYDGISWGEYWGALVPGINVVLYGYGLWRFVGIRDGVEDIVASMFEGTRAAAARLARPRLPSGRQVLAGGRRMRAPAFATFLVALTPIGFGGALQSGALAPDMLALQSASFEPRPLAAPATVERSRPALAGGSAALGRLTTFSRFGVVLPDVGAHHRILVDGRSASSISAPNNRVPIDAAVHPSLR